MTRRLQGRAPILGYAGVAGALFLLSGCADWDTSSPDAQYAAVCVDQRTGNRLDDDACGDWDDDGVGHTAGTYFLWMPLNSNGYIPPVGQRMPPNSPAVRTVPKNTPLAKGTPRAGGTGYDIKRGGFGVGAGTSGGSKGAAGKAGSGSGGKERWIMRKKLSPRKTWRYWDLSGFFSRFLLIMASLQCALSIVGWILDKPDSEMNAVWALGLTAASVAFRSASRLDALEDELRDRVAALEVRTDTHSTRLDDQIGTLVEYRGRLDEVDSRLSSIAVRREA